MSTSLWPSSVGANFFKSTGGRDQTDPNPGPRAVTGSTSDGLRGRFKYYYIPPAFKNRINKLGREVGWAGPDSGAVTKESCELALNFVGELLSHEHDFPMPRVAPSILGGISLQWDFPATTIVARMEDQGSNPIEYQIAGPGYHQENSSGGSAEIIRKLRTARQTPSLP